MTVQEIECYGLTRHECDEFVVKYGFEDSYGNKYLIQFKNDSIGPIVKPMLGKTYEITYFVWDDETGKWSASKIVKSNIYRLMKTIFGEAVPMFLNERPWVKSIRFEGLAKEKEKSFITQRTKLYSRYLTNNPIKGYSMERIANRIALSKSNS